jgi:general secretion pathway protein C
MQLQERFRSMAGTAAGLTPASWGRFAPMVVAAALVLLLAWQAVQLVWTVLGASRAPAGPDGGAPSAAAPPTLPSYSIGQIVNAHLFGVAGAKDTQETDPNAVAATNLNLVLAGTIAESDPTKGYAIIGDSAANAKVYGVGRAIPGGAKLHSVYADRVILDRNGKLEALMLPKKFTGGGAGPPPRATSAAADPMLGERLQNLAAQNPSAITEIIRPQPVFANGQQRGYRVYPGRNREQFARLGLMPGDLVTAINGTPLDDPARGMEILQSMNSATQVTVTVERNGQSTQVNINNALVAAEAAAAEAMPVAIPVTEAPDPSVDEESTE